VRRVFGSRCPQCGAEVIAPEWSEHVSAHCVRNTWSCEICDCQFEEAVYLSAPSADVWFWPKADILIVWVNVRFRV
jgi:hypothetical protein